eukprot:TRINITY_DN2495_c0_g1_i1.p2 TRINITY_DN2495_c0_g1~~TRINITY_DN2495_c0_g1_i1.p2  ORF type:complete len:365 (-),score=72.00 TRINITY_DN2495_c0_g1_i1:113-1207(-)
MLHFALLVAAASALYINGTAVTPSDYPFTVSISPVTLYWRFHNDYSLIELALTVPCNGWAAFGIGDSMTNSDIVMARFSGSMQAQDMWATGTKAPKTDIERGGTNDIIEFSGERTNGVLTVKYVRAVATTDANDHPFLFDAPTNILLAYHSSSNNFLTQHTWQKRASLNFNSTGGATITKDNSKFTHSILMFISWSVLVPAAVTLPAFFKHIGHIWYVMHAILQTIAMVLSTASFVVIVQYVDGDFQQSGAMKAHAILGVIAMALMWILPPLGIYADRVYNPDRSETPFWPDGVHAIFGRLGFTLSIVVIIIGLADAGRPELLGIYIAYIGLIFAFFAFMGKRTKAHGAHQASSKAAAAENSKL